MRVDNFTVYGSTTIAPTAVSATTALPVGDNGSRGDSVLLQNLGTQVCYFKLGTASVAAADANSVALQPGCAMVFSIGDGDVFAAPGNMNQGANSISLITASGTGLINVAVGVGA